jgi:hypothetical protein
MPVCTWNLYKKHFLELHERLEKVRLVRGTEDRVCDRAETARGGIQAAVVDVKV